MIRLRQRSGLVVIGTCIAKPVDVLRDGQYVRTVYRTNAGVYDIGPETGYVSRTKLLRMAEAREGPFAQADD